MPGTYKATGINLKATPIGETDRLLTVLTKEYGLVRMVAPGSRKHQSSLRGRSGVFVVNQLLIAKGRSLDKIIQAETLESYTGLSQDLRKLTASQYLAELVLCQALSDHPQEELFSLLREHLHRVETFSATYTLPCLVHAIYHLLALAGVAPRVHACCITQEVMEPNFQDPNWRVGFSAIAGGVVKLSKSDPLRRMKSAHSPLRSKEKSASYTSYPGTPSSGASSGVTSNVSSQSHQVGQADTVEPLGALELALLQQLSQPDLLRADGSLICSIAYGGESLQQMCWLTLERLLRHYAQFHFERPIRSAALVDSCFITPSSPLSS
jgi:DNA repair protein RecO (recombination protein O)